MHNESSVNTGLKTKVVFKFEIFGNNTLFVPKIPMVPFVIHTKFSIKSSKEIEGLEKFIHQFDSSVGGKMGRIKSTVNLAFIFSLQLLLF